MNLICFGYIYKSTERIELFSITEQTGMNTIIEGTKKTELTENTTRGSIVRTCRTDRTNTADKRKNIDQDRTNPSRTYRTVSRWNRKYTRNSQNRQTNQNKLNR